MYIHCSTKGVRRRGAEYRGKGEKGREKSRGNCDISDYFI